MNIEQIQTEEQFFAFEKKLEDVNFKESFVSNF